MSPSSSHHLVLLCCCLIRGLANGSNANQGKLGAAGACKAIIFALNKYPQLEQNPIRPSVDEQVDQSNSSSVPLISDYDASTTLRGLLGDFTVLREGCLAIAALCLGKVKMMRIRMNH